MPKKEKETTGKTAVKKSAALPGRAGKKTAQKPAVKGTTAKKSEIKPSVKVKPDVKRGKTIKKQTKKQVKKPIVKAVIQAVPKKDLSVIPPVKDMAKVEVPKGRAEIWATGKRKTAIARVRLFSQGRGEISVNKKSVERYFPVFSLKQAILSPLKLLNQEKNFKFIIKVQGGGIRGQAEAIRLGVTRALVVFNPEWRQALKSAGFLRRDARVKERKKPGLKRARRAPQWQKR